MSGRGAPRRRRPWITMADVEERITTDRLELSPVAPDDIPAIAALRMDPDMRRFLGGVLDAQAAEERARSVVGTAGYWAVRQAGGPTVVGLISLTPRGETLELSYEFATPHWGRGIASEAAAAVLSCCGSGKRVVAITQARNRASRRLLERLGFIEREQFTEFGEEQCLYKRPLVEGPSTGTGRPGPG
jgi:ribosomal-protein-alanine N-acetyltransferase